MPDVLTFKPSPKQYEAWKLLTDNVTTELGYGGAAHGGKSYLECQFLTIQCIAYPGTGWLLGRKELLNLKRTTLLTLFKVLDEHGLKPNVHFTYNQSSNIITFTNDSQIFLFDLGNMPSDPLFTRLGGLELTGAVIDESNEVPFAAIDVLQTRLGRRLNDKYGLLPKLFEGFNPDKGHVYSRYYRPWKDGKLPPHRQFIQALPGDNPATTEEYLNQLRNADKITRERLLFGNFEYDADPTALMDYDCIVDLFTNTAEDSDEKWITVDVARYGQDKTVIGLWQGLHCYDIHAYEKQSTEVTETRIKEFARDHRIPYSHILIDEDGIGGGVVDHLTGVKGFVNNSQPIENEEGEKENFQHLKAQCYFYLADYVNRRQIAITTKDEETKQLITQELEHVKRKDPDKDGKLKVLQKDEIKEHLGRSPDFADMLMMRMFFELQEPETAHVAKQFRPTLRKVA